MLKKIEEKQEFEIESLIFNLENILDSIQSLIGRESLPQQRKRLNKEAKRIKGIVFKGNKVSFACILPAFTSEIENTVLYTLERRHRLCMCVHFSAFLPR